MTKTLVERLWIAHARDLAASLEGGYDSEPLFGEAAREIEQLQGALRQVADNKHFGTRPASEPSAPRDGIRMRCHDCDLELVLPYTDASRSHVEIAPINGWTIEPPLRCPACTAKKLAADKSSAANTGEG